MKLVPQFEKMDDWQKENGGIDIRKQKVGTCIIVKTQNSTYQLTVIDPIDGKLRIQGGQWKEPIEIFFNGSTWGGCMLKIGWIGYGMILEISSPENPVYVIKTSPVVEAKIVGENWEFEMDWPIGICKNKVALALPDA